MPYTYTSFPMHIHDFGGGVSEKDLNHPFKCGMVIGAKQAGLSISETADTLGL